MENPEINSKKSPNPSPGSNGETNRKIIPFPASQHNKPTNGETSKERIKRLKEEIKEDIDSNKLTKAMEKLIEKDL